MLQLFLNLGYKLARLVLFLSRYPRAVSVVLTAMLIIEMVVYLEVDAIYFRGGQTLQNLEDRARDLKIENMLIENQIAKESSLVTIEGKAHKMGFIHIERISWE